MPETKDGTLKERKERIEELLDQLDPSASSGRDLRRISSEIREEVRKLVQLEKARRR